jgi:hypothetical protein
MEVLRSTHYHQQNQKVPQVPVGLQSIIWQSQKSHAVTMQVFFFSDIQSHTHMDGIIVISSRSGGDQWRPT